MSIQSVKELFRTTVYEVNKPRKPERSWAVVLNDDALTGTQFQESGLATYDIDLGKPHPVYTDYRIRRLVVTEGHDGSPYHVHVKAEYDLLYNYKRGTPTSRDAVWSADSSPGEVPALSYYDGGTLKPLTNSAGDYFPGLVTQETNIVLTYEKNYSTWPGSIVSAQNHVNSNAYAGCGIHSLKVVGVAVTPEAEDFNNAIVRFWKAVVKIHYRQSGHNLQLPDIGWNFVESSQKRRAMVFDFENSEWVPSPNPVGLNGGGAIANVPAILNRRVNPETNFTDLFGTFPTNPPELASS
jgi:hypothetical protein